MTTREFEHTARCLRPKLLDIGKRFFGSHDRAEDVAQEALMRLWQVRQRLGEQDHIEALALRMARNWCVSQWRHEQHLSQTGSITETDEPAVAPSTDVEVRELMEQLQRAVGLLSPLEQRLFRMRHELEMDIGQIAAVTGIKPRSISAMLSTARGKLRKILKEGGII